MRLGSPMPPWTQSLLSTVLVLVIVSTMWFVSQHQLARQDMRNEKTSASMRDDCLETEEDHEQDQLEISTMPASRDVERLLGLLQETRGTLLHESALGDAESAACAAREYQQLVYAIRGALERLQSHLTPDEYRRFLTNRIGAIVEAEASTMELPEQYLGIFPKGGPP